MPEKALTLTLSQRERGLSISLTLTRVKKDLPKGEGTINMDTLLTLWMAFFGAAVGSFLNVVVYRLPLGKSVVSPPSHCPKCSHRIRWFDNVPVFGWLMLGGKCRDCKEPISIRYPLVEFFCGFVFGIIGFLTLRRGGDADVVNLLGFAGVQSVLIVSLFAIGLIEFDSKPIPWMILIPSVALAPFALYFILVASMPIPSWYQLIVNRPWVGFGGMFVLCMAILALFITQKHPNLLILIFVFVLLCFYFGLTALPIVMGTLFILDLNLLPRYCPFLVLAFVTFGVLCVALI
jgi:hypothetical protein